MFSAAPLGLGLPVGPIDQGMNPLAEVCRPFRADLLRKMVCPERGKAPQGRKNIARGGIHEVDAAPGIQTKKQIKPQRGGRKNITCGGPL